MSRHRPRHRSLGSRVPVRYSARQPMRPHPRREPVTDQRTTRNGLMPERRHNIEQRRKASAYHKPEAKATLHSAADTSRLGAARLGQILLAFFLVAPGQTGASAVPVHRVTSTKGSCRRCAKVTRHLPPIQAATALLGQVPRFPSSEVDSGMSKGGRPALARIQLTPRPTCRWRIQTDFETALSGEFQQ